MSSKNNECCKFRLFKLLKFGRVSLVCVGPGRKPKMLVISCTDSLAYLYPFSSQGIMFMENNILEIFCLGRCYITSALWRSIIVCFEGMSRTMDMEGLTLAAITGGR